MNPQPLPLDLIKETSNGWSDSDPGSNSKNPNHENFMPKSLAIREKFIYDPEHGGGRKRRNKHLPKQKKYTEETDKIGYCDVASFNARLELRESHHNPMKKIMIEDENNNIVQESANPFEIADDLNDQPMELQDEESQSIDPSLYMNSNGEAQMLPWTESAHTDYGL